jgi:hypothetical protein
MRTQLTVCCTLHCLARLYCIPLSAVLQCVVKTTVDYPLRLTLSSETTASSLLHSSGMTVSRPIICCALLYLARRKPTIHCILLCLARLRPTLKKATKQSTKRLLSLVKATKRQRKRCNLFDRNLTESDKAADRAAYPFRKSDRQSGRQSGVITRE